ncbi:hypothetical protein J7E97_17185 [Streptomyces sp. ISL-66]|uniref:hypothetical protein n=1 Tax=Streptomyces sp. ISL-66 TaxID=2819186 RepID=UPI001BE55025|nr:hypothetical protein [Streptomyces sp. ISL-66]MBT2469563.1 hypothetical protein [Streptomyces sp. ISL-66]
MELFEMAVAALSAEFPADERGRMLRSPGIKTSGKFYAFATSADLVVKLPAARVAELVATGIGRPCEPRPGRPMREWVRVVPADDAACLAYLREARAFVAFLTR